VEKLKENFLRVEKVNGKGEGEIFTSGKVEGELFTGGKVELTENFLRVIRVSVS